VLAACVAMFWLSCPKDAHEPTTESLIRLGAKVSHLIDAGQSWRLLSGVFLHAAWWHLAINAFALVCIGLGLEANVGARRFLCLFVASSIGGSLASHVYNPGMAVGVSGAVFGLFGAELASLLKLLPIFHDREVKAPCALFCSLFLGLFFLALNLLLGWLVPQVDNAAHIGGLLTGLFLGLGIPAQTPSGTGARAGRITDSAVLACVALLAATAYFVYDYARTVTDSQLAQDAETLVKAMTDRLAEEPADSRPDASTGPVPKFAGRRPDRLSRLLPGPAAMLQFERGVAYHQREQLDEAEKCYRKAIELDPKLKEAYYNLSLILLDRDQDEAIQVLLTIIDLDPRAVDASLTLAHVYASRGASALSHEQLEKAIEMAPDNADAHREIGRSFERAGLNKEALEHYRTAVGLKPSDEKSRYHLGLLCVRMGDEKGARQQHAALLRLDSRLADMLKKKIQSRFEPAG
jgi:rhomboid protease GluP